MVFCAIRMLKWRFGDCSVALVSVWRNLAAEYMCTATMTAAFRSVLPVKPFFWKIVLEKLLASTSVCDRRLTQESFATAFYRLAYQCFATGVDDTGELALSRARELGLKGHPGSFGHRALAGLVGVRTKLMITRILKARQTTAPVDQREADLA